MSQHCLSFTAACVLFVAVAASVSAKQTDVIGSIARACERPQNVELCRLRGELLQTLAQVDASILRKGHMEKRKSTLVRLGRSIGPVNKRYSAAGSFLSEMDLPEPSASKRYSAAASFLPELDKRFSSVASFMPEISREIEYEKRGPMQYGRSRYQPLKSYFRSG